MNCEVVHTADGSVSLLDTALNATYHSRFGALRETRHIYIEAGLHYAADAVAAAPLRVFEMGFGTGLSTRLSWQEARTRGLQLHYTTLEKNPLPREVFGALYDLGDPGDRADSRKLLELPWNEEIVLDPHFTLLKRLGDIQAFTLPEGLHLVYYDPFAPDTSPECWTAPIFARLFDAMLPGACLVTYCAKGTIKRLLHASGFMVQSLPGPLGKREITRALKPW